MDFPTSGSPPCTPLQHRHGTPSLLIRDLTRHQDIGLGSLSEPAGACSPPHLPPAVERPWAPSALSSTPVPGMRGRMRRMGGDTQAQCWGQRAGSFDIQGSIHGGVCSASCLPLKSILEIKTRLGEHGVPRQVPWCSHLVLPGVLAVFTGQEREAPKG